MKNNYYFLIILIFVLIISCQKQEIKNVKSNQDSVKANPDVVGIWEGIYDNTYPMNIIIYEQKNGQLIGKSAIEYPKRTATAELTGRINGNTIILNEPETEKGCGSFNGSFDNEFSNISGNWTRFSNNKTKSFSVKKIIINSKQFTDFQSFWNEFKIAIANEDLERICSLTSFPFISTVIADYYLEDETLPIDNNYLIVKSFKKLFISELFSNKYLISQILKLEYNSEPKDGMINVIDNENTFMSFHFKKFNGTYKLYQMKRQ